MTLLYAFATVGGGIVIGVIRGLGLLSAAADPPARWLCVRS